MTSLSRSANLPAMPVQDALMAQIAALLTGAEGRDDPAQLERTLTDGYAQALALEAEHWRLQQRIRKMTAAETASRVELAAAVRQLKRQEDEIGTLRQELGRLQLRHSSAIRALS